MTEIKKNIFLIKHKKALLAPNESNSALTDKEVAYNRRLVASFNMNLQRCGFSLSREFLEYLTEKCKKETICSFAKTAQTALAEVTGDKKYKPIWPNFPDDIAEASIAEAYIVNFLYYITGGQIQPEFKSAENFDLICTEPCCVLNMGDNSLVIRTFASMITSEIPISNDDAAELVKYLKEDAQLFYSVLAAVKYKKIKVKENLARFTALCIEHDCDTSAYSWLLNQFTNARDVLRLAAALSGSDVSLATKPRFKSLPRWQRRTFMNLLRNISRNEELPEQMVRNREEWKRFGEMCHPGEYACRSVNEAFSLIRSNTYIPTFESKVELAASQKDYVTATKIASERPNYLARRLDEFLRKATGKEQGEVLSQFTAVLNQLDTAMLVTVANQMRNRDNISLQTGKKNGAGTYVSDRKVEDIPMDIRAGIYNSCLNELHERFMTAGAKKIYLSEEAKGIKFATSQRKLTRSLHSASTGSAFAISEDECEVIRLFLYWDNEEDRKNQNMYGGTDLDLAVSFMNSDFKIVNQIAYFNPKQDELGAFHSGDVRSAFEKPGCEFVDFNIKKAINADIRYVAATVNVYDGDVFAALSECFCGWMVRDSETGELFEPKTVKNKYDLTSDSKEVLMVVFDLQENKAYIGDVGIGTYKFGNAYSEADYIELLSNSIVHNNTVTLVEMARLWSADGKLADSINDADIIISDEEIAPNSMKRGAVQISPYDSNAVRDALLQIQVN